MSIICLAEELSLIVAPPDLRSCDGMVLVWYVCKEGVLEERGKKDRIELSIVIVGAS